uniref:Uncharacterized protein n=1 Tax=Leersia perrieri TaxID=77586 RepID=A0A0D9VGI4_9ORYZ
MEVFIHEDYVNKRREQRRRRIRRPAVALLQVVQMSAAAEKKAVAAAGRLPPVSPVELQESLWDQPDGGAMSPSAAVGSPGAPGSGKASSFADHLLGYL